MAIYEYECRRCGRFDVQLAIGTAPNAYECPECADNARRVYSSPGLAVTSPILGALHEQEEKTREAPAVVSEVPAAHRGAPERPHPALARLPRP